MDYLLQKYRMENVLEKYVGRRPELIEIEKELEKIVDKINSNVFTVRNIKGDLTAATINKSDENRKIEKLFKKFFGLRDFVLNWMWTPLPDAFTYVKAFQLLDPNFTKDRSGRDFNSKLFVGVQVATGLVTLMGMNAGEIMAVILHEIGHSFNPTITQVLALSSPIIIMRTEDAVKLASGIPFAVVRDVLGLNKLFTHVTTYKEQVKDTFKPIYKVMNYIMEILAYVISVIPKSLAVVNPAFWLSIVSNPIRLVTLYNVEKHSDGFAVDYGYGKEIASALNKLNRSHNHPKMNIPVINWLYAFDDLVNDVLLEGLTGYPTMHNRQRSALDRLKQSAKDPDLDPRLKKELELQIKAFDKYYNDYYMNYQENDNQKYFATFMYRQFVDKFFGGKLDPRELVYALEKDNPRNHDYVKEYDRIHNK